MNFNKSPCVILNLNKYMIRVIHIIKIKVLSRVFNPKVNKQQ